MRCRNRLWRKENDLPRRRSYTPPPTPTQEAANERANERYTEWRSAILKRDRKTCALCGTREWIQVHHIERWADNQAKRYDLKNGVCLCSVCHARHHGPQMQPFPKEITAALLAHIQALYGDGPKQSGALTTPSRRTNRPGSWQ